jgi:hypothetical protein
MVDGRNGMKYIYMLLMLIPINTYLNNNKPCSQHYTLTYNTPVWFCIPDQLCWTRGKIIYLWNYYPIISSGHGLIEFNDVVWEIGYE